MACVLLMFDDLHDDDPHQRHAEHHEIIIIKMTLPVHEELYQFRKYSDKDGN
ncbi:hypothetical protein QTH91_05925 [Variovorax dokdonensis]|uniref:Uncharacterized protein n=1 Tax=Variovorax dokdonensis TaxID=344883 RepID=A0ABT7N7W7_9BURK|nr:hypothetical protein [Variovorax dokdonensis]MDM0044012.1 hypothetical protein [Variovorax dokdonensis]